jgi:hypothetical protein
VAASATLPSPGLAPAHPAPAASGLETALLAVPPGDSLTGALARIRSLWGPGPLELTSFRAHLEQLRRLDLPAALELFHPARRETAYLALVGLERDAAVLARPDGASLRVPISDLDRFWTHEVSTLWRDLDGVLRHPDPAWADAWAAEQLGRLGYAVGAAGLADAVTRFQAARDLAPDGVVGSRTLMTVYSLRGEPRPRLSGGAG